MAHKDSPRFSTFYLFFCSPGEKKSPNTRGTGAAQAAAVGGGRTGRAGYTQSGLGRRQSQRAHGHSPSFPSLNPLKPPMQCGRTNHRASGARARNVPCFSVLSLLPVLERQTCPGSTQPEPLLGTATAATDQLRPRRLLLAKSEKVIFVNVKYWFYEVQVLQR